MGRSHQVKRAVRRKVARTRKPARKKPAKRAARAPRVIVPRVPDFSAIPDLSCPDWEDRIRRGASLMPDGLLLYQPNADRALGIFERLRLPDVTGTPTFGDAAGDWFKDIVTALGGTWNGISRSVREIFLLVPKKNSKTTGAAGAMVTMLLMNERPLGEFLLVAPTQKIASTSMDQAIGMIELDPVLRAKCHIQEHAKIITLRTTGASLEIKSFDPKIVTGSKNCGVLIDELHVIAEYPNADRVIQQLRGGMVAMPEAFFMTITTQSERPPVGVFKEELSLARKVRDGELRDRILPILYEFPADMLISEVPGQEPWRNPKNWHMVTPNNGRSVTVDRLVEDFIKVKSKGEESIRLWASQHLNVEVGAGLRSTTWSGAKFWKRASVPLTLLQLIEWSEVLTVGIDGGGLDDMLALTVCGREKGGIKWRTWSKAWLHTAAVEKWVQNKTHYLDFQKDGDLLIVEEVGQDMEDLGDIVEQVLASQLMHAIGVDPSGLGGIVTELEDRGVDPEKQIIGVSQGWRMTGAIKTAERRLASGDLQPAAQPLTRWAAENARVEPRGNAIIITKQGSGAAKIDPLMATLNAVELMSRNPAAAGSHQLFFV